MTDLEHQVALAVTHQIPGSSVREVIDKGTLLKRIFQVHLNDGRTMFLKMVTSGDFASDLTHINTVTRLFTANSLPAPKLIAIDDSCALLPYPYMIQEQIEGTKLRDLLREDSESELPSVYEAIGRFYRHMHSIKNERSGLFREDPKKLLYPVSPNDYMFRAEIVGGSGEKAAAEGKISRATHRRLIDTWERNMDYLKDHTSSLVHVSPFSWNIYLSRSQQDWRVSKIMAMGDVLWWDPAIDLSILEFPPFGHRDERRWQAFRKGYGVVPERKRILLYALLELLCAAMGVYMEPAAETNEAWKTKTLRELDSIMDEIEAIG